MIGARIAARYEITREDGEGPAYRAYRAIDHEVEVEISIWLVRAELLATDADRRVFCADALRARAVSHAHLRRVFQAGVHDGGCYVTLQPLDGPSLADRLGEPGDDGEVSRIGAALAEALAAGHTGNLVHGRLSPADVILVEGTPKLGGMGLWRALDPNGAAAAFGVVDRYLAPEVLAGERVSARADVYALAAILADLAVGDRGARHSPLRERLEIERPRVAEVLRAALAEDPQQRPESPAALLPGLAALALPSSPEEEAPTRHFLSLPAGDQARNVSDPDFPTDERPAPPPVAALVPVKKKSNGQARTPAPRPERPRTASVPPPAETSPPPDDSPDDSRDDSPETTQRDMIPAPPEPPQQQQQPPPSGRGGWPGVVVIDSPPRPAPTPIAPVRARRQTTVRPVAPPHGRRKLAIYVGLGAALLALGAGAAWIIAVLVRGGGGGEGKPATGVVATAVDAGSTPRPDDAGSGHTAASMEPCPRGAKLVKGPPTFCIDIHEAPGEGFRPVTSVTLEQAREACAGRNRRLCTGAEWELACRGPSGASYPYGAAYVATRCNARGSRRAQLAPTGSFAECVSAAGILDMSGNAAEWIDDGTIRGSSATDGDGRCSRVDRRSRPTSPDVGYRCCATPGAY